MIQAWELELSQRISNVVQTEKQEMAEHVALLPSEIYRNRERLALERKNVFQKYPLLVGFSHQVRNPGDFITHDLSGIPILVVRGRDGVLRAFQNICSHRGAILAKEPCGAGKSTFICGFHGWSFENTGRLRGIPQAEGFPDCGQRDLTPLPMEEMAGFIFVRPTPGPALQLRQKFGRLAEELDWLDLASYQVGETISQTMNCNWKLMVESNLETYHIPVLHRDSGSPFVNSLMIFDKLGPYGRILLPIREEAKGLLPPHIESPFLRSATASYILFPNSSVYVFGEHLHVLSTHPIDETRCILKGTSFAKQRERNEIEQTVARMYFDTFWKTIYEDLPMLESVQITASSVDRDFLIGRQEHPVAHFHEWVTAGVEGRQLA